MRRTLVALAVALAVSNAAAADWRGVVMLGAWHAERTYYCMERPREYESATPGLGAAVDLTDSVMLAAGTWRTSHDRWTPFLIADWRPIRWRGLSAGLFIGASGGYCTDGGWRTLPLGGATIRYDAGRTAVHLLVIPHLTRDGGSVPTTVGAALSYRF